MRLSKNTTVSRKGSLKWEARLGDQLLGLAEAQHQRLLRLVDGEEGASGQDHGDEEDGRKAGEEAELHGFVPRGAADGARAPRGRYGTTPPLSSTITLSVPLNTFSMVSM